MTGEYNIVDRYILGVVKKILPRNEEIIHSSLFLIRAKEDELDDLDWYFNGYSVISERVSNRIRNLCKNKTVTFADTGLYSISQSQQYVAEEDIERATTSLNYLFSRMKSGIQLVNKATEVYKENLSVSR